MNRLRAGFAAVDITPRGRVDLDGFGARTQPRTRVAGAIMARVTVWESGRTRLVMAVCDLLGFTPDDSRRLEAAIAKATKTPIRNVLLACSHNHSGPMSMPLGLAGRFRRVYLHQVERGLAEASQAALDDRQVVHETRYGRTTVESVGEFRCARTEPGRDCWPGELTLLQLQRERGGPLTFWHLGVHPYVLGWNSRVMHPDYPGPACAAIQRQFGGPAMLLPGAAADVAPRPGLTTSVDAVEEYGTKLAVAARRALKRSGRIALEPLATQTVTRPVQFGFRPEIPKRPGDAAAWRRLGAAADKYRRNLRAWRGQLARGQLPTRVSFRTHIWRAGEMVLIGMPAEIFYDTGRALQRALPRFHVLPIAQAGGNIGYLPRPFSYRHLTYECGSAYHWYRTPGALVPGTEQRVRQAAVAATRKLIARSSRS